jgi:hypothetical protein
MFYTGTFFQRTHDFEMLNDAVYLSSLIQAIKQVETE